MRLVLLMSVDVYGTENSDGSTDVDTADLNNTTLLVSGHRVVLLDQDREPDATTHQLMGTQPD